MPSPNPFDNLLRPIGARQSHPYGHGSCEQAASGGRISKPPSSTPKCILLKGITPAAISRANPGTKMITRPVQAAAAIRTVSFRIISIAPTPPPPIRSLRWRKVRSWRGSTRLGLLASDRRKALRRGVRTQLRSQLQIRPRLPESGSL